jgi:hypothetical protein
MHRNYDTVFLTILVSRAFGTNSTRGQQYSDFLVEDSDTSPVRSGPPVTHCSTVYKSHCTTLVTKPLLKNPKSIYSFRRISLCKPSDRFSVGRWFLCSVSCWQEETYSFYIAYSTFI